MLGIGVDPRSLQPGQWIEFSLSDPISKNLDPQERQFYEKKRHFLIFSRPQSIKVDSCYFAMDMATNIHKVAMDGSLFDGIKLQPGTKIIILAEREIGKTYLSSKVSEVYSKILEFLKETKVFFGANPSILLRPSDLHSAQQMFRNQSLFSGKQLSLPSLAAKKAQRQHLRIEGERSDHDSPMSGSYSALAKEDSVDQIQGESDPREPGEPSPHPQPSLPSAFPSLAIYAADF